MKTKATVLLPVGLIAALFVLRYVALSRTGMPSTWMLYLVIPLAPLGILFALHLARLGAESGSKLDNSQHNYPAAARPLPLASPPASASERLRELDALSATGAISETEYAARRLHIISSI